MRKLLRCVVLFAAAAPAAEARAGGPGHVGDDAWHRPMVETGRGFDGPYDRVGTRHRNGGSPAAFRGTGVPPFGRRYYGNRYFGNFNNRFYGPQYGYF